MIFSIFINLEDFEFIITVIYTPSNMKCITHNLILAEVSFPDPMYSLKALKISFDIVRIKKIILIIKFQVKIRRRTDFLLAKRLYFELFKSLFMINIFTLH